MNIFLTLKEKYLYDKYFKIFFFLNNFFMKGFYKTFFEMLEI